VVLSFQLVQADAAVIGTAGLAVRTVWIVPVMLHGQQRGAGAPAGGFEALAAGAGTGSSLEVFEA
jgi:hypothetical protein